MSAWAHATVDIDLDCISWFYLGAPLGIEKELMDPGIFPRVDEDLMPHALSDDPHVLNYKDVDRDEHAQREIERLVSAAYLRQYDTWDQLKHA
eukprot:4090839-Amphidinium_carterae.1